MGRIILILATIFIISNGLLSIIIYIFVGKFIYLINTYFFSKFL